ncbi:MAG TPA: IPT/TIG domain-containing protein [Planctomycetota bacterium]|nr:IPT/TIG domain-containing protein [Planctomycetota bacterium]
MRKRHLLALVLVSLAGCHQDPPYITGVSPNAGPVAGGTSITVSGTNFAVTTLVFIDGVGCTNIAIAGSGSITATTPAGKGTGGTTVTVLNSDGQRAKLHDGFYYETGANPVTVSSISPTSGSAGTSVTITGANFEANCTVAFGSADATNVSVQSSTQLTCDAPSGSGVVTITITNPDGGTGSLSSAFTFPGTGGTTGKTITTFAGTGAASDSGDNGAATAATLSGPTQIALGPDASLYICDTNNNVIRKIVPAGTISTIAQSLSGPQGIAVSVSSDVYISDTGNQLVKKIPSGGAIATFAGGGSVSLNKPLGLAVDGSGNVYVCDSGNNLVRQVTSGGTVSSFAGTGSAGTGSENVAPTSCSLNNPTAVAIDASGNVYIADTGNARVRRIASGNIVTFAGGGTTSGAAADNGPATSALLVSPDALAIDPSGNLVIADSQQEVVRLVTGSTISLLAGTYNTAGTPTGTNGDNGVATSAQLSQPKGVASGSGPVYYIADTGDNKIRKVQ